MRVGGLVLLVMVVVGALSLIGWEGNGSGEEPLSKGTWTTGVWVDHGRAYRCPEHSMILTSDPPQCGAYEYDHRAVWLEGFDLASLIEQETGSPHFAVVRYSGTVSIDGNSIWVRDAEIDRTKERPGERYTYSWVHVYADEQGAYVCSVQDRECRWSGIMDLDHLEDPTCASGDEECRYNVERARDADIDAHRSRMVELTGFDVRPLLRRSKRAGVLTGMLRLDAVVGPDGKTLVVRDAVGRG